jgi:hypothetical protein
MRYKAQGFPKGGALYLIAEKKRHRLHHETNYPPSKIFQSSNLPAGSLSHDAAGRFCMEIFRKLSTIFRGAAQSSERFTCIQAFRKGFITHPPKEGDFLLLFNVDI